MATEVPREGDREPPRSDDLPTLREQELEEIVADFLLRREDGEDVTVDDYLARYPGYAEELASLLADETPAFTPGFMAAASARPRTIGPYDVLTHVASGGGGSVYKARHVDHGHLAALKVLDRTVVSDPRDFHRFAREAAILRELNLANVVAIQETGQDGGRLYIAMQWIEGTTLAGLRDAVKDAEHRLHPKEERVRLVAKLARALAVAHKKGILHRDLKPSNIMVDAIHEPVLIDFGISSHQDGDTVTKTLDGPMGTPRYLPPELLLGQGVKSTAQGDVYGLGLCLYELMLGVPCFVQKAREALFRQITREGVLLPSVLDRGIHPDLEAVILRATDRDPHHRYPTMDAFAEDLEAFARGRAVAADTTRRARRLKSLWFRYRRHVVATLASASLLALAGSALWGPFNARLEREHRQEQIAALNRRLVAISLVPREIFGPPSEDARARARELARVGADDPLLRLRAAWVAYASGNPEEALASLGRDSARDTPAVHVFRAYLAAFVDSLDKQRIADGVKLNDEVAEERERIYRYSPRLDLVLEILKDAPPRTTALGALMETLIRFESLTVGLPMARRREVIEPLIAVSGVAVEGGHPWARYVRAMTRLQFDVEPSRALEDTAPLVAASPDVIAVCLLHGLALRAAGEGALSLPFLERAARGSTGKPALAAYGWWALTAIDEERFDVAERAIAAWPVTHEEELESWRDAVFPKLLTGRLLAAQGKTDEAIKELDAAFKVNRRFALPIRMVANLREARGESERAQSLFDIVESNPTLIKKPESLEAAFSWFFFGLRPNSRVDSLARPKERPK